MSSIFDKGFHIDVQRNILEQFAQQLRLPITDNQLLIDASLGKGQIRYYPFLGNLELYHFQFKNRRPIKIESTNPANSEWLLININLSNNRFTKTVNSQTINLQKHLPSGMMFYTPRTNVQSSSPVGQSLEIALIRFPKTFFAHYLSANFSHLQNTQNALIYEDLDIKSELLLTEALLTNNALIRHGNLLYFLSIFAEKLAKRTTKNSYHELHPDDVKGLFLAANQLRNPSTNPVPTIDTLAKIAGMSATKFKTTFKQVFGKPPMKYRQGIKLAYAQKVLQQRQKNISEISYELGYSHPSKFTAAYKKHFGHLPSKT